MEFNADVFIKLWKICDVICSLINKEDLKTCSFRPQQSTVPISCSIFYKKVNKFFMITFSSTTHPPVPISCSLFYKKVNKFFVTTFSSTTHPKVHIRALLDKFINTF